MDHLWLLTEERPKPSVVLQIIKMYCKDFDDRITLHNEIKILPHIKDGVFQFVYEVEGLKVSKADTIFIKTVSGNSSFLDFLLFKQERAPAEGRNSDHLIMATLGILYMEEFSRWNILMPLKTPHAPCSLNHDLIL